MVGGGGREMKNVWGKLLTRRTISTLMQSHYAPIYVTLHNRERIILLSTCLLIYYSLVQFNNTKSRQYKRVFCIETI